MRMRHDPSLPPHDPELACMLEDIYAECSVPGRLDRDPLAVVAQYADVRDREVAGLVASVLAFGSVDLILRACGDALTPLGEYPAAMLVSMDESDIAHLYRDFQYRFMFPADMAALLSGIRLALKAEGSLEAFFCTRDPGGADVRKAAGSFARGIRKLGGDVLRPNLLPDADGGSACKRLLLYLRWMIRKDAIDPGGWTMVDQARLIVPLDTHMFATCRERLGFFGPVTMSEPGAFRVADMRAAIRATEAFHLYSPGDPVKYDFALTRPGIDPRPGDERFCCR